MITIAITLIAGYFGYKMRKWVLTDDTVKFFVSAILTAIFCVGVMIIIPICIFNSHFDRPYYRKVRAENRIEKHEKELDVLKTSDDESEIMIGKLKLARSRHTLKMLNIRYPEAKPDDYSLFRPSDTLAIIAEMLPDETDEQ